MKDYYKKKAEEMKVKKAELIECINSESDLEAIKQLQNQLKHVKVELANYLAAAMEG